MPSHDGQNHHPNISKKRKDAPDPKLQNGSRDGSNKRPKHGTFNNRFNAMRDARTISTQASSKALKNGELDVEKFIKAREYEVQALEKGLRDSKKVLTKRAFQQVPKELRRRTASHNVKRVPKRLQSRAKREMIEDNTPATKKKPSRHSRLRIDTIKRLRALGEKKKMEKERRKEESKNSYGIVTVHNGGTVGSSATIPPDPKAIRTRAPKIKKATLSKPPLPKARFRKRQINKSWLPTHLFHTKRSRMTEPSQPLWRFAIPLTPSQKGYRTMHRAVNHRGTVIWDVSYMSTISLQGKQLAILSMLRQLGVDKKILDGSQGVLWREAKRIWQGWVFEREAPHTAIAPVTLIWDARTDDMQCLGGNTQQGRHQAHLFVRVHPSAFLQVWEEFVRLSKTVKPVVRVEDLRFEIGSIELTGPGCTEALLGALCPTNSDDQLSKSGFKSLSHSSTFTSLNPLATPSLLPTHAFLAFEIYDPRLNYPPKKVAVPKDAEESLLHLLSSWPPDTQTQQASTLFSRRARLASQSAMPSQKSINRRKALAPPGNSPFHRDSDPRIPLLLHISQPKNSTKSYTASWTVIAPWKCIQPIWYSLNYYPLSTGGQPKFGGILEQQQMCFEGGEAWFPGDFPGTKAGWDWELRQRATRWEEWSRRPKGKRTAWDKVDLGSGRKGEIGEGWACDWQRLVEGQQSLQKKSSTQETDATQEQAATNALPPRMPPTLQQITPSQARSHLSLGNQSHSAYGQSAVFSVRIRLLPRGTPKATARVYRLPSSTTSPVLRAKWLALNPSHQPKNHKNYALPSVMFQKDTPSHVVQRELAKTLLQPPPKTGEENYPMCPGEEDLIGFVTTGGYNLEAGEGVGIANLLLSKVLREPDSHERRLCIVRNAGDGVSRLGIWESV